MSWISQEKVVGSLSVQIADCGLQIADCGWEKDGQLGDGRWPMADG